jgi:hypothetical protein
MSTHTTKINPNVIDIAKQRYESKQRSKLPTIIVSLASGGKIYPETSPLRSGKIEMRYMTAYDEDILTNATYMREGVLFDKLLEAIIVSDVDINEISTYDKNGLIINARVLSYGSEYPVQVTEPKTKTKLERVIDLTKIKFLSFELETDENGEIDYNVGNTTIKFSYNNNLDLTDTTVSKMLEQIIMQVGDSRSKTDIENFIRYEFMAKDSKEFRIFYVKNTPGLDLTYEFEGENGGTFEAGFQLGSDLFWF